MSFLEAMNGAPAPTDAPESDGAGLDITARLFATLDRVDGRLSAAGRARPPQAPVFFRWSDSIIIPANGIAYVRLVGPDQGHFWYVSSITVGGVSKGVAAAGTADVYVSSAALPSIAAEPGLVDWRDLFAALPNVHFYSTQQLPLRMSEELWVRFAGATPGQQYVAACQITDFQEGAISQDWAR